MNRKTVYLTKIAMLAVVAFVVEFLEVAFPFFPSFLKLDLSDMVALIASFAMGPTAGVLVELVKNLLHLTVSSTGGVGDLANFLVGSAFVLTAGLVYRRDKTRKTAVIGLAAGTVALVVAGAVVNYFITLPLYSVVLGLSIDTIVGWSNAVVPAIKDKLTLILFGFCPFNLMKGAILSVLTFLIYKYVSPIIKLEGRKTKESES